MDKTQLEEEIKKKYIFDKFNSAQELKDWAYLYLNIDLPMGHVYPDSNSSPAEALYRIYDLIKTGKTADIPQVVMVSGRDCYKTASAAVLQVLLTVHFRLSVAVMSAQKPQSEKAISYINSHFRKISKYLEGHGWKNVSDSKSRVEWIDDNGDSIYIRIVVATRSGANCILPETILHTENGKKQAKDLSKGEKVLTWDYFENKDVFVESNGIEYTKKISREIQFDDGSNVIVSDDHLCFTQRGWINAGAVRIGDTFTSNYQGQEVISQTSHSEDSQSKDLKQLLYGTLMGDSSISHNGNGKSFRYSVSHSHKQLLYLHEIQRILQQNDIRSSLCQYNKEIKGKLYTLYKLTSQVHSSFRDLRQEFYVNNKKTITGDILQNLSWEGVAYWFMDDVNGNGIITGKRKDQAYRLATCGFSIEENEIISKWFSDRGMDNSINFINKI
jgi:hypothetical protein